MVLEQSIQSDEDRKTLQQLDRALHGAESMISALLDIARLEGGTIQPKRQAYPLHDLLSDLSLQFKSIAAQRGIEFRVHDAPSGLTLTRNGFVVLFKTLSAMRCAIPPKGVWWLGYYALQNNYNIFGLGCGIQVQVLPKNNVLNCFRNLSVVDILHLGVSKVVGLGLAIVHRMTRLLNYPCMSIQNWARSCFIIEVPIVEAPKVVAAPVQVVPLKSKAYKILCLDNDETILEGMATLLSKWGYHVFKATEPEQAIELIQREHIQVWLIDQHLNDDKIGLDFILEHRQADVPVALITADSDPDIATAFQKDLNIILLKKPLKPASLRSWLSGLKISAT